MWEDHYIEDDRRFTEPSSGDILVEGDSMAQIPTEKRPVSIDFQKSLLFPHMTVAENIGFGLRMRGIKQAIIKRKWRRCSIWSDWKVMATGGACNYLEGRSSEYLWPGV